MQECLICREDNIQLIALNACGHELCRKCLDKYIHNQTMLKHSLITCPFCNADITNELILLNLLLPE